MERISFRDRQIVLNVEYRKNQDGEPIVVWLRCTCSPALKSVRAGE